METMNISFSGTEVVEMAVEIEKNGRNFYKELDKKSSNLKAKEMFVYMAGEERKHIETFREMLSSVNSYNPAGAYPPEYFAYMSALVGNQVFTDRNKVTDVAQRVANDKEGIDVAIAAEKDSILFYEAIKQMIPEKDIAVVDKIIAEEKKHFQQLTEMKQRL